jgi:hypothetical protein
MSPRPAHALRLRAPGCVQGLGWKILLSEKENRPIGPLACQHARSLGHFLGRDFPWPAVFLTHMGGDLTRTTTVVSSNQTVVRDSRWNKISIGFDL